MITQQKSDDILTVDLNDIINQAIDEYLERETKELKIGVYYPSMIPYCLRRLYYLYTLGPKKISKEKLRIFHAGNIIHEFIKNVLKKSENIKLVENEGEFTLSFKDLKIKGRFDNIIIIQGYNEKIVIEVKSIKSFSKFNKKKWKWEEVKLPYKEHIDQLILYLHALNIKLGAIVYVSKMDLQTKTFLVKYDFEKFIFLLDRIVRLHYHLLAKELPEPEAKMNEEMKWQCFIACEFREECERVGGGGC